MLSIKNTNLSSNTFYAKAKRWLIGLLLSCGYILMVVGDEAIPTKKIIEKEPQLNTTQDSKQDFWQNVPEKTTSDNSIKWQRPDSERNEALIKQSTSGNFWNDSDNSRKKGSIDSWQRPKSERNDSLINELSTSNQQKTLWQDAEPQPTINADTPFDLDPSKLKAESSKPVIDSTRLDDSPIKQRFEDKGPKNLTQALTMWSADYFDLLTLNPITLLSELLSGTKKYYHDFNKPYIHQLLVAQPFLDIHSGPGSMYPKFYIAENNEVVYISAYQSGWYQVELKNHAGHAKVNGWMPAAIIDPFLKSNASTYKDTGRWFVGTAGGIFADEAMIQGKLGYYLSEQLWVEFAISEVMEDLSSSTLYQVNLLHAPLGKKTISPFFGIGTGQFENNPYQSTINQKDSSSAFIDVNFGIQWYLSDHLIFRGDIKNYVIALSDNKIDSHQEYSVGFSVLLDNTAPRGIKLDNNNYIDRDDIELGIFIGNLAMEDFLNTSVKGLLINYHFNEAMFIESRFANADISLKNNSNFLSIFEPDGKEPLTYYTLGFGLNLFTGETIVKKQSIRNTTYINTALGSTSFFDRRFFSTHIGAGLMITPTENWNIKIEIQDMIIEQDVLGGKKITNNLAFQTGISLRF